MAVINPKSVKVNVSTGTGVDIEWDDGHKTHYGFQWLRDAWLSIAGYQKKLPR